MYALIQIGNIYYEGNGLFQNYNKSVEYYEIAARKGNSFGLNKLGVCYSNGHGVEQNYIKAIEYYERAANLGNSDAKSNLSEIIDENL